MCLGFRVEGQGEVRDLDVLRALFLLATVGIPGRQSLA